MAQLQSFANLLSPLQVGQIQIRNRVLFSAHVPGLAEANKPAEKYIAYHRARAKGGVGLQITGGTPVHKSGMLSLSSDGLWNLDDSIVPGYRKLAAAVHAEGGRILAQLAHSASTVQNPAVGYQSWAPSAIRARINGHVPHAMSVADIAEVLSAHRNAAARVAAAGMDGVEILAAFGFLPQAFLSPLSNQREDAYGGSLENRTRFLTELIDVIREQIGADKILGVRIPGDELSAGGLAESAMREIAKQLANGGQIDYLNITAYTNQSYTGRTLHWPPTPAPFGLFVKYAEQIKAEVSIPVFTVGRITDPAHAERIIANGQADMVGMTRAHITDPNIVAKIQTDQADTIRPCVGANTCIANRFNGKPIKCMHQADVSSIEFAPSLSSSKKTTAKQRHFGVAGSGPAGLEVARLLAQAGHRVSVFEQHTTPGGQLALWSSVPSKSELQAIVDWRIRELQRLGAALHFNTKFSTDNLHLYPVDTLIVATGSSPAPCELPHYGTIAQMSAHATVSAPYQGGHAMVVNEGRGQAGLAATEALLDAGTQVQIITSDIAVAADLDPTNRASWYRHFGTRVSYTPRTVLHSISGSEIIVKDLYSDHLTTINDIDVIVEWTGTIANDSLYQKAQLKNIDVHQVGDCVAPRSVELAVAEANHLATALLKH